MYFHNDPLSMNGSKTINERLRLLDEIDKIIFVSKWVQNRFFLNLDKKLINKMLPKKTIKDIVDFFKERNISKRIIYNYCLEKKNEN